MEKCEFRVAPNPNCPHGGKQKLLLFSGELFLASPNCDFLNPKDGTHKVCASTGKCGVNFCEKVPAGTREKVEKAIGDAIYLLISPPIGSGH